MNGAPQPIPARPIPPRVVIPSTKKRDTLIAVGVGGALLALIAVGISLTGGRIGQPSANQLTGIVVAKHESGEVEKEISFNKKGMKSKETDSGYSIDVKTEPGGRIYELPVSRELWETRKIGDKQSFIRPPSEQR
jgi:hypothetical protein